MPSSTIQQEDLTWTVAGAEANSVDASMAQVSTARTVRGRGSFSILSNFLNASGLVGTLSVQVTNASTHNQAIVAPIDWVVLHAVDIAVGQGSPVPTPPYLQHVALATFNYVSLLWVPTAGSGTLYAKLSDLGG